MEVVTNSILGLGPGGVIISMKEPFKTIQFIPWFETFDRKLWSEVRVKSG